MRKMSRRYPIDDEGNMLMPERKVSVPGLYRKLYDVLGVDGIRVSVNRSRALEPDEMTVIMEEMGYPDRVGEAVLDALVESDVLERLPVEDDDQEHPPPAYKITGYGAILMSLISHRSMR